MATYNAESALARMIAPHYTRADDETRTLLREIYTSPADLEIHGDQLHVRIDPLTAPRRSRALAGLCKEPTATQAAYTAPTSRPSTRSRNDETLQGLFVYLRTSGFSDGRIRRSVASGGWVTDPAGD